MTEEEIVAEVLAWYSEPEIVIERRVCKPGVSKSAREWVLRRDGYECYLCKSKVGLEVDHIKPKALGGSNEVSNLVTLCKKCNGSKSDKLLVQMPRILEEVEKRNDRWCD